MSGFAATADIDLTPVADPAALAERWRDLEANADGGFFRGWSFVAQQAARFAAPVLLAVRSDGRDQGLALLNRRDGRLFLNETGNREHDSLLVEHNGVLLRRDAGALLPAALRVLAEAGPVVLSGVDAMHLAAARQAGRAIEHRAMPAPAVCLDDLAGPYLGSLSANARGQISRAMRLFGPELRLDAAPDIATALRYFGAMVALHQASWQRRGKPGAFASPALMRFHESLIGQAVPRGEADLLRIASASGEIGYLYNFRHGGRVYCYQSGLAAFADARLKPGLVSHALAIEHYRAEGARCYDLLAGPARYKATLAPAGGEMLHWITLYARGSLAGGLRQTAQRAKHWAQGVAGRNLP